MKRKRNFEIIGRDERLFIFSKKSARWKIPWKNAWKTIVRRKFFRARHYLSANIIVSYICAFKMSLCSQPWPVAETQTLEKHRLVVARGDDKSWTPASSGIFPLSLLVAFEIQGVSLNFTASSRGETQRILFSKGKY